MAFTRWRKNKQIVINDVQEQDPAMSRNTVQQSHPDHQVNNGSTGSGSVIAERPTFININRFRLFGRRGSCSNSTTTTQENENEPIDSDVDCTLRLGCPIEPPSKPQQQQVQQVYSQVYPQGGDDNLSAVINNYFPPNNVDPQELMQNYEVMDGRRTPLYPQHSQLHNIDNRFGMNNFNQNNYQLQQQMMNNNMIAANHGGGSPSLMTVGGIGNNINIDNNMTVNNNGMFHTGGSPSTMNVLGNCNNSLIAENHGMFHGGGSPSNMNVGGNNSSNTFIVNNNGMFHGGGSSSTLNVGMDNSNPNNNHQLVNNYGMFHGGGSPSTMNVGMNGYTNNNHMVVNEHGMHGGGINDHGMHGGGSPGMFHGGVSQNNMVVNNNGMFNGGGRSFTMNAESNSSNNFGMLHGGRGGCDLSSVVVALPSPGVGPVGDGFNGYNIPYPLPPQPPNNFHVPFLNNNIPPPFPAPQLPPAAPAVFLAAPRRDEPYHHHYPPQPQPVKRCFACKTLNTPLWRNGPKGPKSLCNACGIRYKKEVRRIMGVMAPDGGQQGDKKGKF